MKVNLFETNNYIVLIFISQLVKNSKMKTLNMIWISKVVLGNSHKDV